MKDDIGTALVKIKTRIQLLLIVVFRIYVVNAVLWINHIFGALRELVT